MTLLEEIPNRTISVRGIADPGTIIKVYANNVLCKDGPVTGNILFEFTTPIKFHGALPLTIIVLRGKITIGDTVATYPALINQSITGYFSFRLPFEGLIVNENTEQYENYTITLNEGDSFNCWHLLINGPYKWDIEIKCNHIYEGMTVFTENVDCPLPFLKYYFADFCYDRFNPYHKDHALEQLIEYVKTSKNQL